MKKKILGKIIVVSMVAFIGSALAVFIFSVIGDINMTNKNKSLVIESFDEFKNEIVLFSDIREDLTIKINEELYYSTLDSSYLEFVSEFDLYNNSINTVKNSSFNLIDNCLVKYNDINIDQKCEAFALMYEEAINLYVADVELFNEVVDKYNSNNSELLLDKYDIGEFEYIDYNNDSQMLGKRE